VIPKIVYILTGSDTILIILNYLSNGRVALWNDLLGEYQRASVSNMLFGFGSTDIFVLKTWDHKTSNTHNLYFTLLITYGVFIYLYLYFAVAWLLNRLKKKEGIIIIAILTAGISTSILFSFSNIPLVLLFVYFITLSLRPIKNSGEKHLELKKT
jgi:hypothetical protein